MQRQNNRVGSLHYLIEGGYLLVQGRRKGFAHVHKLSAIVSASVSLVVAQQLNKRYQEAKCTHHTLLSELAAQELHDPGKLVLGVNLRASTAVSAHNEASVARRA